MKTVIAALIVAAAMLVPSATATEDLGDIDPFTAACRQTTLVAKANGVTVRSCRRASPDQLFPDNTALIHMLVITSDGRQIGLDALVSKSLWQIAQYVQH